MTAVFTDILKARLETLLGMRGPKGKSAVTKDDLNKLFDQTAFQAKKIIADLVVTDEMIVDGAVSRRAVSRVTGSITVDAPLWSTPTAISEEMVMALAPYQTVSGVVQNPLMMTVCTQIKSNTAIDIKMLIGLQRKDSGGAWIDTLPTSLMTCDLFLPDADYDHWRNVTVCEIDVAGEAVSGVPATFRLVAYYTTNEGQSVTLVRPICILEQVNK